MKYRLRKRNVSHFYLSLIVNNLRGIGFLIFVMFNFYVIYYYIFFLFIGKSSVDVAIGFSIFLLFFLLYKKGRRFIYSYVSSLTKNLYLNFVTLNKLLLRFRILVYRYNRVYLQYFRYNFFVLKIVSNSMSLIYNNLSLMLLNKYLVNSIYSKLNLKLYYITTKTNNLPIEYMFKNNYIYELNIFLAFDSLLFIL
jgi:hypothetical protein